MSPAVVWSVILMSDMVATKHRIPGSGNTYPLAGVADDPGVFTGDLIFDRALETFRQDAPGVGLDFVVLAGVWMCLAPSEHFAGFAARRGQGGGRFSIEWNVEVNPHFLEFAWIDGAVF